MASSPTVLDWQDIQVLVGICSKPTDSSAGYEIEVEAARLNLIHALHQFIREWHPGRLMENSLRRQLVDALDEYAIASRNLTMRHARSEQEDIRRRLLGAMEAAEKQDRANGGPGIDGVLSVLLMLALQQISNWPGN